MAQITTRAPHQLDFAPGRLIFCRAMSKNYKAGLWRALSTDEEYLDLMSLTADGKAARVGEQYLVGGVVEAWFQVGKTKNPMVNVSERFFDNALRDYSEWPVKWWREVIQNAVDEGARNIYLTCEELEDGTWELGCDDDGPGMGRELLFETFLKMGATGKDGRPGAIGGFGKAKELILGPWISWIIHTRDIRLQGVGLFHETYEELPVPHYKNGTSITVIMPADQHSDESAAREFLERCNTSGVKFFLNNVRINTRLARGTRVKDLSNGVLYRNQAKRWGAVLVRVNGLYMFSMSSTLLPKYGTIIAELTGDSKKFLTANRDGFVNWREGYEITGFVDEVRTEGKRALQVKENLITETWEGEGRITTEQGMTDILDALGPLPEVPAGEAFKVDASVISQVAETSDELGDVMRTETGPLQLGPATSYVTKEVLHDQPLVGASSVEALAQQLAWRPDFMLHNEVSGLRIPKKFTPEGMTGRIAALVEVWAEACRWVFIQLGERAEYGVGLTFSTDALALAWTRPDGNWLLLNPLRTVDPLERLEIPAGDIMVKSNRDDMKELYARAIHEVTHIASGYMHHESSFAGALTHNFALCADGFKTMMRIAKGVKTRKVAKAKSKKPQYSIAESSGEFMVVEARKGGGYIKITPPNNATDMEILKEEIQHRTSIMSDEMVDGLFGNKLFAFMLEDRAAATFLEARSDKEQEALQAGQTIELVLPLSFVADMFAWENSIETDGPVTLEIVYDDPPWYGYLPERSILGYQIMYDLNRSIHRLHFHLDAHLPSGVLPGNPSLKTAFRGLDITLPVSGDDTDFISTSVPAWLYAELIRS
jgi:hypothetical protein